MFRGQRSRYGFVLFIICTAMVLLPFTEFGQRLFQKPLPAKSPVGELRYDEAPPPELFAKDNLQLYLRVKFGFGWGETTSYLLPSIQLFWPHLHVVVVFDADEAEDRQASADIEKLTAKFAPVQFRSTVREQYTKSGLIGLRSKADPKLEWHGYQREHVDMMYADEIVQSKYIAIADSDALLITLVSPTTVFSPEGKPRVIGAVSRSAMGSDENWRHGVLGVEFMLKKDFVISCMSYFPVILKREHIRMFREHVERVHKKPFIEVYKEMFIRTKWYCHYSMMCNYVWHFHKDDYVFHYHSYVAWRPGWDSPQQGQIKDFSFLNDANKRPVVRASTHASYTLGYGHLYKNYIPEAPCQPFLEGFCHTAYAQCQKEAESQLWNESCAKSGVNVDKVQPLLFRFEYWQSWEWEPRIREAQREHYKSLKTYRSWISWGAHLLNQTQPKKWGEFLKGYKSVLHGRPEFEALGKSGTV